MEIQQLILILHVFGAAIVLGTVTLAGIIGFKKTLGEKTLAFSKIANSVVLWAIILAVVTGILLFLPEKDELTKNNLFIAKIVIFVLSGIIAQIIVGGKVKKAKSEQEQAKVYQENGSLLTLSTIMLYVVAALGVLITLGE